MTPQRAPFCKLANPATYVACDWNLCEDHAARAHWVAFFKRHLSTILQLGTQCSNAAPDAPDRAAACRAEFFNVFDRFHAAPQRYDFVSIITLDNWRDDLLRKHGFGDAFHDLKNRENAAALPLLPAVCQQIDALEGEPQLRAVIQGVFAGNIFDMGAEATAQQFLTGGPDFFETRKKLPPRPWLIDQYDLFAERMLDTQSPPKAHGTCSVGIREGTTRSTNRARPKRTGYSKVIFFIDNAGSDFVLNSRARLRAVVSAWITMRKGDSSL